MQKYKKVMKKWFFVIFFSYFCIRFLAHPLNGVQRARRSGPNKNRKTYIIDWKWPGKKR